jgi:hypothetical protein
LSGERGEGRSFYVLKEEEVGGGKDLLMGFGLSFFFSGFSLSGIVLMR